jgi:lipoate-protein ligase A
VVAVVRQQGSVAELHALDPFAAVSDGSIVEPQVWWCDPTDSALVLGSRQSLEVVDIAAAGAAGLNVARRRSGGGAVVVRREACAWVDVIVPHGLAPDDIRGAMVWIGEHWLEASRPLLSLSGVGDHLDVQHLDVHRGGMLDAPWSELVCFAGIGPGEVLLGGRKLVGLSQRRTRHGLRLQGLAYRSPMTVAITELLVGELPDGLPAEPAFAPGLEPQLLAEALAARLSQP